MTGRSLHLAAALLLATSLLAACGKKGQPTVPNGEKSTYPHPYPAGAPQPNPPPNAPGGSPGAAPAPPVPTPPDAKPNS